MHIQRILVISLSFLGIISVFLPWLSFESLLLEYSENGLERNGWFIIFLFALCIILSILKDLNHTIGVGFKAGIILCSILACSIVIIDVLTLNNETDNLVGNFLKTSTSVGVGVYLLIISGLSIPLVILLFRNKL
jgi:hypothetical protein